MPPSTQIAQQIAAFDANRKSSADVINAAMAQYGVPQAQSSVANLRTTLNNTQNALNGVDPSVTGRTSGSLVTEAQRQKIVNNERAPIAQNLQSQQGELSTESANLTDSQAAARALADAQINDATTQRSSLESQYQDAVAAEAAALAKAQNDRDYQLQAQKVSSTAPSAAQIKQQDMATTAQNLQSKVGKDGHVSQETWNKAMSDWLKAGYSADEFVKNNIQFVNQRYAGYHGFN